jgi:hypothetical protein
VKATPVDTDNHLQTIQSYRSQTRRTLDPVLQLPFQKQKLPQEEETHQRIGENEIDTTPATSKHNRSPDDRSSAAAEAHTAQKCKLKPQRSRSPIKELASSTFD